MTWSEASRSPHDAAEHGYRYSGDTRYAWVTRGRDERRNPNRNGGGTDLAGVTLGADGLTINKSMLIYTP